jgi:hypothetical protein
MRARARLAFAVALVPLLTGCFQTKVRSGLAPDAAAPEYDPKWHHGWIAGAVEGSGPHDLAATCPNGWAEVQVETNAFQALVSIVTWFIYMPEDVSVVCAAPASPAAPPAGAFDVAPTPSSSAYPPAKSSAYPPSPPPPDL